MPTGNEPALPQKQPQEPMLGGPGAITHIALQLRAENMITRVNAAEALAAIGTDEAVDALATLLNDGHLFVLNRVIHAIGRIGTGHAAETILALADDQGRSSGDRGVAIVSLRGPLASDAVAEQVARHLQGYLGATDFSHWLEVQAVRTLAHLTNHHFDAVSPLMRPILDDYLAGFYGDGDTFGEALGVLEAGPYLDELTTLVLDEGADPGRRRRALLLLTHMRAKEAAEVFLALLANPDWRVRRRAASICRVRRLHSMVPALLLLLNDARGPVRLAAAQALVALRVEDAREALLTMMTEDRSRRVRDGLARITEQIEAL